VGCPEVARAAASGRRRAEEAVAESARFQRTLLEALPVGVFRTDARGRITYANERCFEIGGLPVDEVYSGAWLSRMLPDERTAFLERLEECLRKGDPIATEVRFTRPDGRPVWVWAQGVPERDGEGRQLGLVGTVTDLTPLRRTEQALRVSESRFGALADAVPVGVFQADAQGRAVYVNRRLCEMTGYAPHELLGRATAERVHPEDRPPAVAAALAALGNRAPFSCDLRFLHSDGSIVWVFAQAVPERDASGAHVGFVGTLTDISERKRVEAELDRHRERLEDLVSERTAELARSSEQLRRSERLASLGTFAAGIAHQINNPVGSILLAAQFARDAGGDTDTVRTALEDIVSDAKRCGRVVRSVLEFARGDQQDRVPNDVNEIVRDAMVHLAEYARERDAAVHLELAPGLPPVLASPSALEQVVANVVENAVDAGARRIVVHSSCDATVVSLCVEDDGRGVSEEDRRHLFDPFFTTRRSRGGTGLGLSIAHGIVTSHGGTMDLESELSRGTRVSIRLPRMTEGGS
jgi:PAS domain S-box-containing protein